MKTSAVGAGGIVAAVATVVCGLSGCLQIEPFSHISAAWVSCERVAVVFTQNPQGTLVREDIACASLIDGTSNPELLKACAYPLPQPPSCQGGGDATNDSDGSDAGGDVGPDSDVVPPCEPGNACDDGNACTLGDLCNASGECVGVAKDSSDGVDCTPDACDPATGACSNPTDDCQCSGDDGDCDDGAECTDDVCGADLMCTNTIDATNACSDGDACTEGDFCTVAGACQPGTAKVCDDGSECTADSCDSATGDCVTAATNEGGACEDGDACTSQDVCESGVCVGGPPPSWKHTAVTATIDFPVDVLDDGARFLVLSAFPDGLTGESNWRLSAISYGGQELWSVDYPSRSNPKRLAMTTAGVAIVGNGPSGVDIAWIDSNGVIASETTVADGKASDAVAAGTGVVVVGQVTSSGNTLVVAADSGGVAWGGDQGTTFVANAVATADNHHVVAGMEGDQIVTQSFGLNGLTDTPVLSTAPESPYSVVDLAYDSSTDKLAMVGRTSSVVDAGNIIYQTWSTWLSTLDSTMILDTAAVEPTKPSLQPTAVHAANGLVWVLGQDQPTPGVAGSAGFGWLANVSPSGETLGVGTGAAAEFRPNSFTPRPSGGFTLVGWTFPEGNVVTLGLDVANEANCLD